MEIHFHVTEWKSANSRLCLSTLALNQGPQTCQVGLSANTASGQPLKVPWETVMRDSWSLTWKLGKHGCDDLIWPADGSRQFGERTRDNSNWEVRLGCFSVSQERAKARWLIELLAVSELKGSCQTKPQAVQPHSLEIMREEGGKPKESLHCVFKERRFYFFLIMQKRKKRSHHLRTLNQTS